VKIALKIGTALMLGVSFVRIPSIEEEFFFLGHGIRV
jgi:hypothetical protein